MRSSNLMLKHLLKIRIPKKIIVGSLLAHSYDLTPPRGGTMKNADETTLDRLLPSEVVAKLRSCRAGSLSTTSTPSPHIRGKCLSAYADSFFSVVGICRSSITPGPAQ